MADLVQIVDAISATANVRLDLNDEVQWWVVEFKAPPPRLRRAVSANAMRDGVHVSSSNYDARTLTLTLQVRHDEQDDNAAQLQALARELDRADNFLMYQPDGASKPVFFRTLRSDFSDLRDVPSQAAMREMVVEVLCEPFALGLMETLGPYAVAQDPAAVSNGCYFDVDDVIGDIATPCVMINTESTRGFGVLAVRQHGTPSDLVHFVQAEDTSRVTYWNGAALGAGADAAMSGSGTNYVRTTFTSFTSESMRLEIDLSNDLAERRGQYNVYATVRRSDDTSEITVGLMENATTLGTMRPLPLTTSRQLVFLGTWSCDVSPRALGYAAGGGHANLEAILVAAGRSSGTATLDWDCIHILPADEATLTVASAFRTSTASFSDGGSDDIFDGYNEFVGLVDDGEDPMGADPVNMRAGTATGGFPLLIPGQVNRLYWLAASSTSLYVASKSITDSWSIYYWPRYVFVRPDAT